MAILAKSVKTSSKVQRQSEQLAQITTVYQIPSKEFKTEGDVLRHNGYELQKQIGYGGFAVVHLAKNISNGEKVACKVMNLGNVTNVSNRKALVNDMRNELMVMERSHHPFIVHLYIHFVINNTLYIFMQLANAGTLSKLVHESGPLSESESRAPFAQILCGIAYMHRLNIAHRDLKLSNILLLSNPTNPSELNILISDFGLSRVAYSERGQLFNKTYCGTPVYMAPEISGSNRYNAFLVDVWALGVILYVMVTVDYPFDTNSPEKASKEQKKRSWKCSQRTKVTLSKELTDLLDHVFEANPRKRISISKMTKHVWIAANYRLVMSVVKKWQHNQSSNKSAKVNSAASNANHRIH